MIFSALLLVACYALLIFVVVRCADGRIGINGMAGIRTRLIMTNQQTWLAGHKAAKNASLAGTYGAVALTVIALFLPGEPLQATTLLLGCGALLGGVLYGANQGNKAAQQVLAVQHPN
ncbi:SdpI family protein [Arthrobacter alpinus]|nr:SdpI family protein [Arthrobacter alpinus]